MKRWVYRKRSGWKIGRWILGYERRDYEGITIPFIAVWPTLWKDKPPPPLAPAPQIDPEALKARRGFFG